MYICVCIYINIYNYYCVLMLLYIKSSKYLKDCQNADFAVVHIIICTFLKKCFSVFLFQFIHLIQ